jgi:extracellular elastinolytic metalloproteinase
MNRYRNIAAALAGALALTSSTAAAQAPPGKGRKAKHEETRTAPAGHARAARTAVARAPDARPVDIAVAYVRENATAFGLTAADISDMTVMSELRSEHNGVTHIYLRQRFDGIEVHGAEMNVNVSKDGRVFGAGNSFVANLAEKVRGVTPDLRAAESIEAAASHLAKAPGAILSEQPVTPKLVYEPLESGDVVLGWHLEIDDPDSTHYWAMTIDAQTGELLEQFDYTVHDTFEEPDWNEIAAARAEAEAAEATADAVETAGDPIAANPVPGVPGSGTYRVWAWPHADPNDGDRSTAVDPADAFSSPFGWHDTNGLPGAESTGTVGNNVDAYLDILTDNNAVDADRAGGGAGLLFDHPVDFTQNPSTYRPAAITNLFYWNNIIHDVSYRYGFTESAGNFQVNHYGRFTPPAGVNSGENDPVRAEAQDGGGMNNANFSTGNDGSRPRMQMFLWVPQGGYEVQVADGGAAGKYPAARANFGAFLADIFVTQPTAQVIATSPTNACSALAANSLAGKIAFIEPGGGNQTCSNVLKVQRAQAAGAIAVILATTDGGAAQTITGTSGTITIPVLALNAANAALVRPALPFTAKLAFLGTPAPLRDGDFDAGVIIHEYGHGISNRLTGGRLVTGCLNGDEQMGEGWSDFLGLVLTHDETRSIQRTRGMGPYIRFTGVDGPGIRTTRYSTDITINPTTYGTTTLGTLSVPHGVGYAWATALWEVYWNLIDKHGFNQNVYDSWDTGGNNLAIQLVMDGMKMQPCRPGFVTGRNAILAADDALTGTGLPNSGANQCSIWRGFAKRGLGFSAAQGSSNELDDNVEAFNMPPLCQPGVKASPAMLTTTQIQESTTTQLLNITNDTADDGLDLSWTITETASDCSTPTDLPWLSVSPATGITAAGKTDGTIATFDATGLDVGTYTGKLCISGAGTTPTEVPVSLRVIYDFDGFGSPIGSVANTRKAGAAAPVRFSLNGFKGLDIFAAGYPASRQVVCATGSAMGPLEPATAAGGSILTYDVNAGEYHWVWKTSADWRNTCREFVVGLDDGTLHPIRFAFN